MLKHSFTWLTLDKSKVFGILWVYIDIVSIKCSWLYTPSWTWVYIPFAWVYIPCLGLYTLGTGGIWRDLVYLPVGGVYDVA